MQEIRISLDPANARAIIRQYSGGHYDPKQPRDKDGKWTAEGHTGEAVKAATARKTALEGGKRGEAGRHHALQLAHEAAAAIKSGQGSSEHLGKLEAAVTALRIQHYQAGKRGESDDSVNEKKAVYTHFNGLLKGLKNAAAGKGEVPDVGAHGESKPDLTSAGSGASDTGVKNQGQPAGYNGIVPGQPSHKEIWQRHQHDMADSEWMNKHHIEANNHLQNALEALGGDDVAGAQNHLSRAEEQLDASRRTSDFDDSDTEEAQHARAAHRDASRTLKELRAHVAHVQGKPDLTSADNGAMYGGVKNDLHTDQHVKIAQQRNFHQSWAARTSEEAHAGGRIVEADPRLRQLAYAHERVADGYNSLLKGSHMQFPEQAAHNAIARLNDLKGTPAEKTESYGAARRGAEALLERTKGERLKGMGQAAEDLNDEVLRPMMRGEAYNEDAYNASSSLQRALYQNESGGYSPDRSKDIQRHFNDAKTAFDRVPEGHPAKPVLKKALDQAGEFLSQHAVPQPRGDQSNHREHAVLAKLLRGHQATFNTGGTGVSAAASGHESVVKAAQAFGTPDMERHLANAEDAANSASPDHAALIRGSVKRLRDAHAEWQKGGAANAEALRDHMDNLHEIAHGWDVNFDSPSAKAKGMATALNVQQAAAGGDKVTRRATLANLKEKARAAGHLGEPMLKYVAEQEAALGNRDEGKAQQAKDALMQAHAIDPNMHKDVKEVYKRLTLAQRNAYDDVNAALLRVGQAHAHAAEGEHDVASAKMQEAREHLAKVKPAMLAKLPTAVQQAHRAATEGLQA